MGSGPLTCGLLYGRTVWREGRLDMESEERLGVLLRPGWRVLGLESGRLMKEVTRGHSWRMAELALAVGLAAIQARRCGWGTCWGLLGCGVHIAFPGTWLPLLAAGPGVKDRRACIRAEDASCAFIIPANRPRGSSVAKRTCTVPFG